jgi:Uma2 family endonuclease
MTVGKTLMTAEELILPRGLARYELIHGELVESPLSGAMHGQVLSEVAFHLMCFTEPRNLGAVLIGDTGIILARNPDHVRAPDACFISAERVPNDDVPDSYLEFVPDLMIEVISPDDAAAAVQQKTEEWLQAGARVVWTLYPASRSISVSEAAAGTRVYHDGETLHGEPVLPGFAVAVSAFFD